MQFVSGMSRGLVLTAAVALGLVVHAGPLSVDQAPKAESARPVEGRLDVEDATLPEAAARGAAAARRMEVAASAAAAREARLAAMSDREREAVARTALSADDLAAQARARAAKAAREEGSGAAVSMLGDAAGPAPARAAEPQRETRTYANTGGETPRSLGQMIPPDQRDTIRELLVGARDLLKNPLTWFLIIPVLLGAAALALLMSRRR